MIIDIHAHLFSKDMPFAGWWDIVAEWSSETSGRSIEDVKEKIPGMWDTTGDLLVQDMDEAGVDMTIMNVLDPVQFVGTGESLSLEAKHRIHAEAVGRHPDRLRCFAGVDPGRPTAVEFIEAAVEEWGMIGLKLHPCFGQFYANDRKCYRLYEKCVDLGIPVMIHVGLEHSPFPLKYGDPVYVDDVALDFPELKIIMAHGALTPFWWPLAATIASVRQNVFLDLGFCQLNLLGNQVEEFYKPLRTVINQVGPSKVLFGTDWPALRLIRRLRPGVYVKAFSEPPDEVREAGIEFSDREIKGILGDNAARVLGLAKVPA